MPWFSAPPSADDRGRLARIERKLDLILAHLGLDYEEESPAGRPSENVSALIRAGRKIEAIKAYREETGVGLKEAKDAVEAMEQAMGR